MRKIRKTNKYLIMAFFFIIIIQRVKGGRRSCTVIFFLRSCNPTHCASDKNEKDGWRGTASAI